MAYSVPRREMIADYVTKQTSPTYAETIQRALAGRLQGDLTTEETVAVLLRSVKALYLVAGWLADELDKIELTIAAR